MCIILSVIFSLFYFTCVNPGHIANSLPRVVILFYIHVRTYTYTLEVYRYGNFGFYRYRLYFCQNLPIPITDLILILYMSSNYSLYLACIKLDGLATYYHVAKLPQHFYTLKLVNYGNIYNCYSNLKLI